MKKQPTLLFELPKGFHVLRKFLSGAEQSEAVEKCRALCRLMPLYAPRNKFAEFNLKINSFGDYGWHSSERGYCYLTQHPHGFCEKCRRWARYRRAMCGLRHKTRQTKISACAGNSAPKNARCRARMRNDFAARARF
jgi:hypothetical protein